MIYSEGIHTHLYNNNITSLLSYCISNVSEFLYISPLLSLPSLILNLQRHNHLNVVNADVYIPAGNMLLLLLNSFYSYKYT